MAKNDDPGPGPATGDEPPTEQEPVPAPEPAPAPAPAPVPAAAPAIVPAAGTSASARRAAPPRRWLTFSLFLAAALVLGGFVGGAIGAAVVSAQTHSTSGPDRIGDFRDLPRENRGFGPGQNGGESGSGGG